MKFDSTYKECDVVTAVKRLLNPGNRVNLPAMILWDDKPMSEIKLRRYLTSRNNHHFLRFGVACNGGFILDEVYHLLTTQPWSHKNADLKARAISIQIRSSKQLHVFIVSNCHLIQADQISWLTGLMFEFGLKARFLFLLHKDHFDKLVRPQKKSDERYRFFIKQIKGKYVVSS